MHTKPVLLWIAGQFLTLAPLSLASAAVEHGTVVTVPLPQFSTQASATTLYCTHVLSETLTGSDAEKSKDGKTHSAQASAEVEKSASVSKVRLQISAGSIGVSHGLGDGKFSQVFSYQILDDYPGGLIAILDRSKAGGIVQILGLNRIKGTMVQNTLQASMDYTHPSSWSSFYVCSPTP